MRVAVVSAAIVLAVASCSGDSVGREDVFSAATASMGESQELLGWNVSVANLRFDAEYVLVDVDAAPAQEAEPPAAKAQDIRFGLYGALAHPIEANGVGGCGDVTSLDIQPLSATAGRLSGTVCLGPLRDRSQVRGVYAYSPRDRIAGTTVAYPAAFPVGVLPTNPNDAGLMLSTSSVDAFQADGSLLAPTALGEPTAFEGNGYMLIGLEVNGLAERYRDDSAKRGGPMMVLAAPTLPGKGLSHECGVYGASVLVLPDASRDAVQLRASLCTQGEINQALLYATVSLTGTHAGLWMQDVSR